MNEQQEIFMLVAYFCVWRVGKIDSCIVHDAAKAGGGVRYFFRVLPEISLGERHPNIAQR